MIFSMKQMLLKRSLMTACFMGIAWSAALAEGGSLILPVQAGDTIELVLDDGIEPDPAHVLQVFVGKPDACCAGKSPIAGRYHVDGQRVVFDPAFDFVTGQTYTVQSRDVLTPFVVAAEGEIFTPEITAIYPSGTDIPENTLRFYIHFSTPMEPHVSMDLISLVDANGVADTEAFMTFKQELWNQDRTRLTLLMDPGRIKRGVATNMDLGPALLEGKSYAIRIAEGWQAAQGAQEAASFEHTFLVSGALRSLPTTDLWQAQDPRTSTRDPLVITFDRPFDEQMLQSAIRVFGANGEPILGSVSVEDAEREWRFTPEDIWTTSTLQIVVDANLEDVAGNNFKEVLDHAVGTQALTIDHQTLVITLQPASE